MSKAAPPVFFFAFADPDQQSNSALPALQNEEAGIRAALADGELSGSWEFVSGFHSKRTDLIDTFRNNRVAIFHYGGHSNQQSLWLPAEEAGNQVVDGTLLEEFLCTQPSLQLAFFNSCENQAWASKLSARVPYVIASVCKLDDAIAGHFAAAFYGYLASGSTVDDAFQQAAGDVMTTHERALGSWVDKYKQQPPQFRTMDEAEDFPAPAQATFPWIAVKQPDAQGAGSWRLADAAHDPLVGLPPLDPESYDLPERPYVTIKGHGERDAALFFGRSAEIRALADWTLSANDRPISLLYGQSGVGKSSLLNAGLLPRLRKKCRVAYRRRNLNLMDDLYSAMGELLGSQPPAADMAEWRANQANAWVRLAQPSLIILDQVEEAITHAVGTGNALGDELRAFAEHVREIFSRAPNTQARLLLSFRKEYLAEIRGYFAEGSTDNAPQLLDHFWLDRLEHDAIVEVVTGAAESRLTRDKYKIAFPEGDRLPNLIAGDLLKGDSPIATVLQIILNQLWDAAKPDENGVRSYTVALYEGLAVRENPLLGFYEQQLAALYGENEGKGTAQGLELDLLYGHTSELGTSRRRSLDDLKKDYPKLGDLDQLLTANKDRYLLTEPASDPGGTEMGANHSTALAHDTLAPLIRRDFALSVLPGPRARRLLENRAREWAGKKKGTVLDRADLRTVERGLSQMRAVTEDEQRLIDASRGDRRRAVLRSGALLLLLPVLLVAATVALILKESAAEQDALSASATSITNNDQVTAIAEALEAERIHEQYHWVLQLDPRNRDDNTATVKALQQALTLREVYRAQIDPSVLQLGRCAVALNTKNHPLVSTRTTTSGAAASYLGDDPLPSGINDQNDLACDPASGTIVIVNRQQKNPVTVWRGGKSQQVQLPVPIQGGFGINSGGTTLAYGTTGPAGMGIALVDLSTRKLIRQIPGIPVVSAITFSPSGRFLVEKGEPKGIQYIDLNQPTPQLQSIAAADKALDFDVQSVGGQDAVAFAGTGLLQIYRLADGKIFDYESGSESDNQMDGIFLAPHGRLLASSITSSNQIDFWLVPSTLASLDSGGIDSVDPKLQELRYESEMQSPPTHIDKLDDVPIGDIPLGTIAGDAQLLVTAELHHGRVSRGGLYGDPPADTAYLHIWTVNRHDDDELAKISRPQPLFDMGCGLIGNFIDDMADNHATLGVKQTINYPALSKACKSGKTQNNAFANAKAQETKAGNPKPDTKAARRAKADGKNANSPAPGRKKRREGR
jgi:hypothetical protein